MESLWRWTFHLFFFVTLFHYVVICLLWKIWKTLTNRRKLPPHPAPWQNTHTEHAVTANRLSATCLRDLKLLQIKLDLISLRSKTEKNCWTLVVNLYPFDLHCNKKQDDMLKWKIIYNGWKRAILSLYLSVWKGKRVGEFTGEKSSKQKTILMI